MDFVERLFWSIAIFLGVHFIWLAWLEDYAPLMVGTILAVVLSVGFFLAALRFWPHEHVEQ